MKKTIWGGLIGLFALIFAIPAFPLTPYDDFSGPFIDKTKWADGEFVREIVGQKLVSKVAAPNSNDSTGINVGTGRTYRWANNSLNFVDPSSVNSIQADVSVLEVSHTNPTRDTRAMLAGRWYNDGGVGTQGGGDIWAAVFLGATSLPGGTVGITARWEVTREMNQAGTAWFVIAVGDIPIPVSLGATYTLYIGYDDVAKQFTFKVGNQTKIFAIADGLPPRVGDANLPFKALRTRVWLYGPTESGYISATFDNVYKNGALYDDFSSLTATIDSTKWTTYEFVREISGGQLRTKVRSSSASTSTIESRPSFVDPSSINVIQTNITPIAFENCTGCLTSLGSRIYGRFFHDGTPGGGLTGDVAAQVGIGVDGNTLRGYWLVNRTNNEDSTSHTTLPGGFGTFTTPVSTGYPYPISLSWNGTQFIFKFGGEEVPYAPPGTIDPPNRPDKRLSSRTFLPMGKATTFEALFDDVFVNGVVVTPQFIDFGAVASNTYSDRGIKVVNNSSNTVTIDTIAPLSPPFSILSNDCTTLAPGASCNIAVRFSPIAPRQIGSVFNIPVISPDPDEPSIFVRLNGSGLSAPTPLAGGCRHTLVLENDGTLWAWGENADGQLGIGSTDPKYTPQPVGADSDWSAVAAGCYFSVALKSNGTVWSWGYDNGMLGLGPPPYSDRYAPTQIASDVNLADFGNVVAISVGSNHTLALKSNGTLWAWGWNTVGQTGTGMTSNTDRPTQVGSANDWAVIVAGESDTSFALKSNGTLWAWGNNNYGQLGLGDNNSRSTPTQVGSGTNWVAVAGGGDHTLAIKSDGTLWAWGRNDFGQLGLGDNANRNIPTPVGNDNDWYGVSAGYQHTVAIKSNGSLWTCGDNQYGQMGNGSNTNTPMNNTLVPITIDAYTNPFGNLIAIKAGRDHNIALKNDKTVWTWGHNDRGQLGDGATSDSNRAEKVFKLKLPTTTAYPAGGTYGSAQVVTLIADDPDATIYYTTSGLDPSPGSPGTYIYDPLAHITISSSTTLKFLARETFGAPPPAPPTLFSDEVPKTEVYTITNLTAAVQAPATLGTNGPIPVTATFYNNTDQPIQTIRPDCFNTTFELKDAAGNLVPSRDWIGGAYVIPDDLVTIPPGGSYPVTCDLSGKYDPEVLAPVIGQPLTVESTYTNYIQDPDILPDGGCKAGAECYPLFKGSISSGTIPVTIQEGFTITPSHGTNGTISPSTPIVVSAGGSASFTITPDPGYQIADVVVDGISQGPVSSFNFSGVDRSHTINATFTIKIYTITATAGAHGRISPSGAIIVNNGGNQRFDIIPDTGYHIVNVTVDGCWKGPINHYTFTNVNANHKIQATFAINTYFIVAAADWHGKISPFGVMLLKYGDSKTFTITPYTGYHVSNVYVDGKPVGAVTSYTFNKVTGSHFIFATFAKNQ